MSFEAVLKDKITSVNQILERYLPDRFDSTTADAMNYSVKAGGKRLRPIFLLEVFNLFCNSKDNRKRKTAECFAAALEFIHTYSLVHDDLPEMDNDMYRRGKLTTHAKFGAAMGILAGDALLNEAFTMTAKEITALTLEENPDLEFIARAARAQSVISEYAGKDGMILGQEIDILSEGKTLSEEKLLYMYELKTSRLIQIAFKVGAILGGATETEEKCAEAAALNLGKAFQVQDDILDVTGDEQKLGKPVLSDEKNDKKTYVAIKGLELARNKSEELTGMALDSLKKLPGDISFIEKLMLMLLEREF